MLSIKSKYALSVIFFMASLPAGNLLSIKELSERCSVPKKYLEQILNELRRVGIVRSTRGANGGYQLGRASEDITVMDIISVLEHSFSFQDGYFGDPVLKCYWESVDIHMEKRFNMSINSLVKEKKKQESYLHYSI